MAAAARPPGIGDARVPCPLCGGLIHPVAGRCKHCKEDLTAFRAGRPQAPATLPALNGHTSAPVLAAVAPIAVPAASVASVEQQILPQRTTGRSLAAQRPGGRLLRNWPMLVIILAMIAIVVAVVIMLIPPSKAATGGKRQLMPTPAPDRMDTMPDNKQSSRDPWSPDPGAMPRQAPAPPPSVQPDPPADPDDAVDPDDPVGQTDPDDLYGSLLGGSINSMFLLTMASQACKKLRSCPNADDAILDIACRHFSSMPLPPVPTTCPAARRCLAAIDHLDCNATGATSNPLSMVMLIQDCTKAATEC